MYLNGLDFTTLADADDIELITNSDSDKRDRALKMALDEVRSYMRKKYRIEQEFAKTNEERNDFIIMITLDITLYHLFSMLAPRMGMETRQNRYDNAIKWLAGVRDGKTDPGIPSIDDPLTNGTNPEDSPEMFDAFRYGSNSKNDYSW